MGDLVYATLVIIIIWAGIFVYLAGQNRRLKRLEEMVAGMKAGEPIDRVNESVESDRSDVEAEG